jgi:hypothetical protein
LGPLASSALSTHMPSNYVLFTGWQIRVSHQYKTCPKFNLLLTSSNVTVIPTLF